MNIKDYLKYYVGQQCQTIAPDGIPHSILETINYYWLERSERDGTQLILILRKLEDITEDEAIELVKLSEWHQYGDHPHERKYVAYRNSFNQIVVSWGDHHKSKNVPVTKEAFRPDEIHWLLSHGFDLFGLIKSGDAIDSATLTNK